MNTPYDALVKVAADAHGIPPDLLWGQIYQESSFNPLARHDNKDASGRIVSVDRGIAQINSVAHPEISDANADSPQWAITWMAGMMADYYKQYQCWDHALIAYNAGHYTPSDEVYAQAVFTASKLSPFVGGPNAYNKPAPAPVTPITVMVENTVLKAIAANNKVYIIWTALDILKTPYQKLDDSGKFAVNGATIQGIVYQGETYLPWDTLSPGIIPGKIWRFTS